MAPVPEPIAAARRTAAVARAGVGLTGAVLSLGWMSLHPRSELAAVGFAVIVLTSASQRLIHDHRFLALEEAIAASAALLIVGLGHQQVTILSLLWLCAAASGLVARGGRVHWASRTILLTSMALPIVLAGRLDPAHVGFFAGAVALLSTCGRLTRELNDLLEQARYDADHDALTGVSARPALRAALTATLERGQPVRLLLVDLDDFGQVNKARGHAEGDRLLRTATARLQERLPPGALLGRLGGDEFAILAPLTARGSVEGATVLGVLGRTDAAGGPIDASVGIAHAPQDGDDADAVLRAADIALRVAKRHGKRQAVIYDGASLTDDPVTGARGALMRLIAGEGLEVAMQPIVDVTTGRLHAYEALARFRTHGTEAPLHWFAIADELGLRAELEIACLRAALKLFPLRPPGVLMSVNLSATLLFDRRVDALLDAAGDVNGLIVEVTEDSLVREDAGPMLALGPLLERGIVLAVDDVGAGYSGLGQLTVLRPALVKLDRGLVAGIDTSPHRAALVEALVGYARRTGGELVAEGVETAAELETVAALGVRLVQGFALARPGAPWPQVSSHAALMPAPG